MSWLKASRAMIIEAVQVLHWRLRRHIGINSRNCEDLNRIFSRVISLWFIEGYRDLNNGCEISGLGQWSPVQYMYLVFKRPPIVCSETPQPKSSQLKTSITPYVETLYLINAAQLHRMNSLCEQTFHKQRCLDQQGATVYSVICAWYTCIH